MKAKMPAPDVLHQRIQSKTARASSGYLLWTGSKNRDGYGKIDVSDNFSMTAHRLSWELANGSIPAGMCVLHTCDNPACVELDHLFLGTSVDNVADKVAKNRQAKGQSQAFAKLTDDSVRRIRSLAGVVSMSKIATRFGVSKKAVLLVIQRKTWRHVQ